MGGMLDLSEVVMCEERRNVLDFSQNPNIIYFISFLFCLGGLRDA